MTLRYLSVCSGIEAATVAWHPLGWQAAAYSEIESFPRAVLAHHYPDVPLHGDFTTIRGDEYGPVQLLVGGTPCQSFSVAGLRGGLADGRGNLALEFLRLAQRARPSWVVWENVPGVLSSLSHTAPDPCPPPPPLDLERDGQEVDTQDEYRAEELHAFNCFLAGLRDLGYGFAYRVLDAQFIRVDGFARAVPQRRRRVFVVGYLGDWRRAAAVLFEREGLSGHLAPRRSTGEGSSRSAAISVALRGRDEGGVCELGDDVGHALRASTGGGDKPHVKIAFGGNNTRGPIDAATAVNAHGGPHGRQDFESETFVVAPSLTSNPYGDHESREGLLVAHSLRAEGFDASEDGTGRGTPIAFDARQSDVCVYGDTVPLDTKFPGPSINQGWAVRRLTPLECCRLQGFADDYLSQVTFRGKPAADGPMYKALGNSKAIPPVRWIGQRIDAVERLGLAAAISGDAA